MGLFDKLKETEERFDALGRELEDPAIMSNGQAIARISKERGALERLVSTYRQWKDAVRQRGDAELLLEEDDPDMQAEAKQEIARLSALEDELEEKLKGLLVAADEDSHRDAIVEIRGGTGGDEASLFASDLFRMYSKYAERRGWKIEVQGKHETDVGGFKDITFLMRGDGVYAVMAYESGGHRVQRVPKTESQGRIHTSAATVAVLPKVDAVEVQIDPGDLKIDLYSAGGPGGQHVNKTQSAVRITHLPSGIVVQCQDERSQHKNKDRAMSHLRSRLYDHIRTERDRARGTLRKTLIGSGDRSDRIRTYNYPQNRVTDHRINVSIHSLEQFLEGEMDPLIEKLQEHDKEQRLAALGSE